MGKKNKKGKKDKDDEFAALNEADQKLPIGMPGRSSFKFIPKEKKTFTSE